MSRLLAACTSAALLAAWPAVLQRGSPLRSCLSADTPLLPGLCERGLAAVAPGAPHAVPSGRLAVPPQPCLAVQAGH